MPLYQDLRKYLSEQDDITLSGAFDLTPDSSFLLGFEKERVESLPTKQYIRRLWLAFDSGKGTLPRSFIDPLAQTFSNEINKCVNSFVNNPIKLAAELTRDAVEIADEVQRDCGFLEGIADVLLVKEAWGDHLWGSRKYARTDLFTSRIESGYETAPVWPKDKDR